MRLNVFQKAALITTATTYLLIAVGGLVRATDAGLGCPDWPLCFNQWIPPTSAEQIVSTDQAKLFDLFKAWTEYLNRVFGMITGFLILGTLILAVRGYRNNKRVLYATISAFILVLFEGWLGGQVVKSGLRPLILTAHLIFALLVVSLLLYASFHALNNIHSELTYSAPDSLMLQRITLGAILILLIQIGLGASVRGIIQDLNTAGVARPHWIQEAGIMSTIHKGFALFTSAAIFFACVLAMKTQQKHMVRVSGTSLFLLVAQLIAGFGLNYFNFPAIFQVIHLWASSLLLGTLTVQALLAAPLKPTLAQPTPT